MDHVIAARAQMGTSLAFHIVFAALGVGLPVLLLAVEGAWLRTGNRTYYELARTWSKAMAILFAVGAVSGTVLSFELGLLWPEFMRHAGGIIGLPFSFEGFAFFIEAIFIGLYLYGWERLSPRAHWACGIPIAISGAVSAGFIVCANAWMNMPTGFRIANGQAVDIDPIKAMFAAPWATEVLHATLAAYVFTGFAVAGVYAFAYVRGERTVKVRAGLRTAMLLALVSTPLQLIVGDVAARFVAEHEPTKFAAMESLYRTQAFAPLTVGGFPNDATHHVDYALELPGLLSILAHGSPSTVVGGLDRVSAEDRPPVAAVHWSFDAMVGCGTALLAIALAWLVANRRRRPSDAPNIWIVRAISITPVLALVALEAGWCVTEFGRQPWIARGLLRTSDAVTSAPGLDIAFYGFSILYVVLALSTWWLIVRLRSKPAQIQPSRFMPRAPA